LFPAGQLTVRRIRKRRRRLVRTFVARVEHADGNSTRNANRVTLGDGGASGQGVAGNDGEDGQTAVHVQLDADGAVQTLQTE